MAPALAAGAAAGSSEQVAVACKSARQAVRSVAAYMDMRFGEAPIRSVPLELSSNVVIGDDVPMANLNILCRDRQSYH